MPFCLGEFGLRIEHVGADSLQHLHRSPMRLSFLCKRLCKEASTKHYFNLAPTRGFATRNSRPNISASAGKNGSKSAAETAKANKAEALARVLSELNDKFGKNTIMTLSSNETLEIERVSTGALTLDMALGGGLPKGRIIEIYGPESSGKTTLALQAIAAVQKAEGTAVLVDAEHAFDPHYARRSGVLTSQLHVTQPDSGEQALEMVDQMVRSSAFDIIVIDSVAALVPKAELEGEIGDKQMGLQARMMSQAMRKISGNASKCNTMVIFINQLRMKIGVMYGNPETTTGGHALKYFSSVRIDVRRIKTIEGPKQEQTGIRVKAKVVKNKVAPPFKIAEFDIMFNSGINTLGSIVEAAEKVGVLKRKGAWYSYNNTNIGQGKDKTVIKLREDTALREEIEEKTRNELANMDVSEIIDDQVDDLEPEDDFKDDDIGEDDLDEEVVNDTEALA